MSWRALSFFLGLSVAIAPALRGATVNRDLESIKKKIEKEKQGISRAQKTEGSVLQALGKIEGELQRKTKELKAANAKFDALSSEVKRQEVEAEKLKSSVSDRTALWRRRAAALYRWRRSGGPLLLLNGAVSASVFLKRKHYLETTLAYDRELADQLNQESKRQDAIRAELAQKKAELNEQRQALARAQDGVRKEGEKKQAVLASIRQEKETRVRALKELEQAARRLEKMMEELAKRAHTKPPEGAPAGAGLAAMMGKLDWPVTGELVNGFGKTRHPEFATEIFRNGIDIEAPLGREIKAVERGRVVFAERFSGYGNMVIIDHGDRYYTVYAHLSELLKKKGDQVRRGETLGRLGDSDSLAGARLYFEMRKDGRSVDPLPWFRKP